MGFCLHPGPAGHLGRAQGLSRLGPRVPLAVLFWHRNKRFPTAASGIGALLVAAEPSRAQCGPDAGFVRRGWILPFNIVLAAVTRVKSVTGLVIG